MQKSYRSLIAGCSLLMLVLQSQVIIGQFVLNGSASELSGNCYQLTPDQGGLAGSMFSENSIDLTQPFSLSTVLHFGCKDANGADGIVFILATSNTSLGGGGGFIGYEGITPSIAVEYDDYLNGWGDPASDHMAVISNGSVDHNAPTNLVGPIVIAEIEDCEDHCFFVNWDPMTLTLIVILDDTEVISYTGDIVNLIFNGNPNVYFGFSAGTGSLSNLHTVCVGPPELVPMEDVTLCAGESIQLEADENGAAWTWDSDPTLSDLFIMDPIATPTQTTTYMVDIEYSCGGFASDTVEVTLLPEPAAVASNNGPLCSGEDLLLMAGGGVEYEWSGPDGFFSSVQNPNITDVDPDQGGIYVVTVTDAFGCTTEASTSVVVHIPADIEIEPVDLPICEGAESIQLEGTPSQGTWSGEIGPTGIFDPISAGVGIHDIYYTITDNNGCLNTALITLEVVPNTPALIIPDGPFCANQTAVILSATPAGGVWGEAADPNGRIYPSQLGVGTHLVTYEFADQNGCFDAELFIEVLPVPDAEIMQEGPFCQNIPLQVLSASPDGGVWGGVAGPSGQITPAMLGEGAFDVIYTFDENGCADSDTIIIVILPEAPQVSALALQCDSTASGFVVTFEITGGDASTYQVTGTPGGTLIPGTPYLYVSDTIPTGGSYIISIDDINHCDPITLTGSYSCFCSSGAGTMDLNIIQSCADDTITVIPTFGALLDPNDSLIYVLHEGNSNFIDSVIMVSGDGQFVYSPLLQSGVTYYISAVVGNAGLPYGVDFLDPCLSVTIGTPVQWYALPTGFLNAPSSLCNGDSVTLIFSLNGIGPFDVVFSDGSQLVSLSDISNGHSQVVSPQQTTSYTLVVINDQAGPGCNTVLDTTVTITVHNSAFTQQVAAICNGDSLFIGGTMQMDAGVYHDTLQTVSGCDSIIETTLIVYPVMSTFLNLTSCDSSSTGVFLNIYPDQRGCDSTVITTIAFAQSDTSYITNTTCDESQAGVFAFKYLTQEGCDSIVIESVTLLPHDTTALSSYSCDISEVGVFTQELTNQFGCDSILILSVVFSPPDTTYLSSESCNPSDVGTFTDTYQNAFGCDSLVIEEIALVPSFMLMQERETCDPDEAGVFVHNYITQFGCDSIITEQVGLLQSDKVLTEIMTCEAADTGFQMQFLVNQFGCDSLIITHTQLAPADTCAEEVLDRDIYIPNVFSPNGDATNDDLYLYGDQTSIERVIFFRLYDRWGELIVEKHDFLPGDGVPLWNGTFSQKPMEPGVFVWVAEVAYVDGLSGLFHGDVTLVK